MHRHRIFEVLAILVRNCDDRYTKTCDYCVL